MKNNNIDKIFSSVGYTYFLLLLLSVCIIVLFVLGGTILCQL